MTEHERRVVLICGFLAILIIVVRFALLPAWDSYHKMSLERPKLTQKLQNYRRVLGAAAGIEERLERDQRQLAAVENAFISENDPVSAMTVLLGLIEEVASSSGVRVLAKDVVGTQPDNGLLLGKVSVSFETSPAHLTSFLYLLEHNSKSLQVDGLEISSPPDSSFLSCRVTISAAFPSCAGGDNP